MPQHLSHPQSDRSVQRTPHKASTLWLAVMWLAVFVATLYLTAAPARAQTTPRAGAGNVMPTAAAATDYERNRTDGAQLGRADTRLVNDLAKANLAEIDTGKLALQKSKSDAIKQFAQQMIDAHTQALGEVEALAQKKGLVLPYGAGAIAKSKGVAYKALSSVSENLFDREYARHAGIGSHETTVRLLKKIETQAQDADLKALAGKMLPAVEQHLVMARDLVAAQ